MEPGELGLPIILSNSISCSDILKGTKVVLLQGNIEIFLPQMFGNVCTPLYFLFQITTEGEEHTQNSKTSTSKTYTREIYIH